MKTMKPLIGLVIIILGAAVLLSGGTTYAKTYELSLSLVTPPAHLRNKHVILPWIQMLEERSGGKLKVTPYYANALAPFPEQFDAARKGIADMSEGLVFATPGRFPLTETTMLPNLGLDTSINVCKAFWEVYKKFPKVQAEWTQVRLLWVHSNQPAKLVFRNKEVRTIEGLKGMKISVTGSVTAKVGEALGFTPVAMPMSDVYLALEKGVLDGAVANSELLVSRRFGEVSQYLLDNSDMGSSTFFVVMNKDTWNRLPKDLQKVFDELSGDWGVEFTGKAWDTFKAEAKQKMLAKGYHYINLAPEELAKWNKLVNPVKRQYAESLDAKGLPGTKVLEALEAYTPK